MQLVGELLGIADQFQGVDKLSVDTDGSLTVMERVDGGRHQLSRLAGPPAVFGWATGNLPEPPNNPQVGMLNMRGIMPALQKASPVKAGCQGVQFASVALPKQKRETRLVKDMSLDEIAQDIVSWIEN
jgi:electron transfer flavoprotein beta subunit